MIEVEVDCNSDVITIKNKNGKVVFDWAEVKQPNKTIDLLERVFNEIYENMIAGDIGVSLTKIDEDNRTTVGEW